MSQELKKYIQDALGRGASQAEIAKTLGDSGWSDGVIQKTMDQFAGVDAYGVPVPAPRMQAHQIARDLCIYVLTFVTLSMSACALGGLLFDIINRWLPDAANQYHDFNNSGVNWAIAQLVIAFPVYGWLSNVVNREVNRHPEKRESLIRKLLIYFIVVITAIVGLGDLVTTLYTFLSGEITMRFVMKALVVLGISGTVFLYYLAEMKRDDALVRK